MVTKDLFVSQKIDDLENIFLKIIACISYKNEGTKNIFIIDGQKIFTCKLFSTMKVSSIN